MLRTLPVALVALLAVPAAAEAGEPIMPLSEVRQGMRCSGLSVVKGTAISAFDVLVEDVVRGDPGADAPRLLVRVSGPAVDATGIGPGFSGSPVVCDGRIAGAISESIGEFGGDLALATPIEHVLRERVDPPTGRTGAPTRSRSGASRAAAAWPGARPLAGPLTVAGISGPVARAVRRATRGRVVAVAPAAPKQAPPPAPLRPGSAVAVGLASGDVTAGAVGTVAYVDGDRVWAFGHPLDAAGRRSLLLQDAYVYAVVANPAGTEEASTYKLAAPVRDIGTLTNDGIAAVVGRTGVLPRTTPLRVRARDRDTGRERVLDVTLADEVPAGLPTGQSALSAVGPLAVAQAAYTVMRGTPARVTAEMCAQLRIEGRARPLRLCNRYLGGGGGSGDLAGAPAAADLADVGAVLDAYEGAPLRVRSASVALELRRGLRLAILTSVRGPRVLRRGRTVTLRLGLRRAFTAERLARRVRLRVPRGAPRGARDLVLSGTPADGSATDGEAFEIDLSSLDLAPDAGAVSAPRTLAELAEEVRALERWDGVTGQLVRRGEGADPEAVGFRVHRADDLRIDGEAVLPVIVR